MILFTAYKHMHGKQRDARRAQVGALAAHEGLAASGTAIVHRSFVVIERRCSRASAVRRCSPTFVQTQLRAPGWPGLGQLAILGWCKCTHRGHGAERAASSGRTQRCSRCGQQCRRLPFQAVAITLQLVLRRPAAVPRQARGTARRRCARPGRRSCPHATFPALAGPQGYLAFYLNKYLGQYVEGIDQKQFR